MILRLNELKLTTHDVRDFAVACIGPRIFYALNQARKISVYEYDLAQKKLIAPHEMTGDNSLEGQCVNPRFCVLPSGQLRLYVTAYDPAQAPLSVWLLRFVDLPIHTR